jgi:hypothetical protein
MLPIRLPIFELEELHDYLTMVVFDNPGEDHPLYIPG